MIFCHVCQKPKTQVIEGRYIDGSCDTDRVIPAKHRFEWVCSYECYVTLLPIATQLPLLIV